MSYYSSHPDAPTPEERQSLEENFSNNCEKAAEAILQADIFCLHIGAGFSADSGLAVYKDIADVPAYHEMGLDYADLCDPCWLDKSPGIFFGFMGKCFNDYRKTVPHSGYNIIKKWYENRFSADPNKDSSYFPNECAARLSKTFEEFEESKRPTTNPFCIYSSNVDSHPLAVGFNENEMYEIHGTMERWQCSVRCTAQVWNVPEGFEFIVNEETMIAEDCPIEKFSESADMIGKSFASNFPKCINCDALARPNILMFGDGDYVYDSKRASRHYTWEEAITKYYTDKKLVILEIGCGIRIPSIRSKSQCTLNEYPNSTLIRVNPDYCLCTRFPDKERVISICSSGLNAINEIDKFISMKTEQ